MGPTASVAPFVHPGQLFSSKKISGFTSVTGIKKGKMGISVSPSAG